MSELIRAVEAEQMNKKIPDFRPGDTVVVKVKVKEGSRERLQAFEGVVIAKRNRQFNSSFVVRKISHGVGVERTFQTYSPQVDSISVKRRGDVRRAKLYYLRERRGRKARIKEKLGFKDVVVEQPVEPVVEEKPVDAAEAVVEPAEAVETPSAEQAEAAAQMTDSAPEQAAVAAEPSEEKAAEETTAE